MRRIWFAFCAILLVGVTALAQDSAPVIVYPRGGPLSTWTENDDSLIELGDCADEWLVSPPAVSPDGTMLAQHMFFMPEGYSSSSVPVATQNIWLCDIAAGTAIEIAGQTPIGADEEGFVANSRPTWSPDGTHIAWAELAISGEGATSTHRLIVYDIASSTARVIADDLGEARILPANVDWGQTDILVEIRGAQRVYSPEGEILSDTFQGDEYSSYLWMADASGDEFIAGVSFEGYASLLDPMTGTKYYPPNGIEMYSMLSPDGLAVTYTSEEYGLQWVIVHPNGELQPAGRGTTFSPVDTPVVGISPDGEAIVFSGGDAVVYRNGIETQIPDTDGRMTEGASVAWGPVAWRVRGEAEEGGGG